MAAYLFNSYLLGLFLLACRIGLVWNQALIQAASLDSVIYVDFFVFLGRDGKEDNVAPRTSMNIEPPNDVSGFSILCKDRCPMFDETCGTNCLSPQMRWCKCVAELLVEDLSSDFGALRDAGESQIFALGDYVELSAGQALFDVPDGHTALYSLMDERGSQHARRSGRVTIWVSNNVKTKDSPNSFLAGTTLLDQPLWKDGDGAGVLLNAQNDRGAKVLSHEVGHVVGFHHTAGPSFLYVYEHPECPECCRHVETHPLIFPTCEKNIMGYWYNGPYCCPGSFVQLRRAGHQRKECIRNSLSNYKAAHCCGSSCTHTCPKEMPEPKFATKEHKEAFTKILQCWLHLRALPQPESKKHTYSALLTKNQTKVRKKLSLECFDYKDKLGTKLGTCV